MSRYIDIEPIEKEIERELTIGQIKRFSEHQKSVLNVYDAIKKTPTADVEEVRHGTWDVWGDDHCCSECAQWALFDAYEHIEILSHFCPYCGAKMDKEVKDNAQT